MKKITLILLTITLLFNCTKNDEATSSNGFAGTYRGVVNDTLNGDFISKLNDYAIIINPTNTPGQVSLSNNLIVTNTGTISGTSFSIPTTVSVESPNLKATEWAIGEFEGPDNNTWNVVFYQEQENPTTGDIISKLTRTCSLVKQ